MPNKIITTSTLDRFKDNLADVAMTGDYDDISNIPMWRGTRAEHDAEVKSGTLPNNIIVGITDEQGGGSGINNIVEGYRNDIDGLFYEESAYTTAINGVANTEYIDLPNNKTYRWDGTDFVRLNNEDSGYCTIEMTFDEDFEGYTWTITDNENDTYTGTVPATLSVIVNVKNVSTVYRLSCPVDGFNYFVDITTGQYYGQQTLHLPFLHIYGAEWEGGPSSAWTRTNNAEDFVDPIPYVAGATTYGSPFDNIYPWSDIVIEERTGGTMVKIPKFWYKLTSLGNGGKHMLLQITDRAYEGWSVSPLHMDRGDGKGERDYAYIGRYHCASDWKSKTGVVPKVSFTRSAGRSNIHNLGENIWQIDRAARFTIWLLYLVEFAHWDSQEKIGYGCGEGNALGTMGYTDDMPYHTGTTKESRDTYGYGTQYRYIEGLWDNCYDWCDGFYKNASQRYYILRPSAFNDTTTTYGIYTKNSVSHSSNYYVPNIMTQTVEGLYPDLVVSSFSYGNAASQTYSCDSWEGTSDSSCLTMGGSYGQTRSSGLFYSSVYNTSAVISNGGSRIMELP